MRRALAALAIAAVFAGGALALAQSDIFDPTAIAARERDQLLGAKQQSAAAMARSTLLEKQALAASSEADRLKKRSAALAARIQSAEADISAGEARVALVSRRLSAQRTRLARQQQPLLELAASLQQLSRQPPVSVLAQPGSLTDMVHARAVIDAAMPVIERRTAGVRRELTRLDTTRRQQAVALRALSASKAQLAHRRDALTRLENEGRLRSRELMSSAQLEADRALGLGEKARDIVDLMDSLEADGAVRAELAQLAGPLPRPRNPGGAVGGGAMPVTLLSGLRGRGSGPASPASSARTAPSASSESIRSTMSRAFSPSPSARSASSWALLISSRERSRPSFSSRLSASRRCASCALLAESAFSATACCRRTVCNVASSRRAPAVRRSITGMAASITARAWTMSVSDPGCASTLTGG